MYIGFGLGSGPQKRLLCDARMGLALWTMTLRFSSGLSHFRLPFLQLRQTGSAQSPMTIRGGMFTKSEKLTPNLPTFACCAESLSTIFTCKHSIYYQADLTTVSIPEPSQWDTNSYAPLGEAILGIGQLVHCAPRIRYPLNFSSGKIIIHFHPILSISLKTQWRAMIGCCGCRMYGQRYGGGLIIESFPFATYDSRHRLSIRGIPDRPRTLAGKAHPVEDHQATPKNEEKLA